ncbi:DUF3006 domain-containing protein [Mahella australiensis]|uniref:Uncharacterized protein n=1 Tax=Mahella australiensis (strain DSM 15567 / CIP 107919 / 50-1 BON) TaxID=697281 RepID=F3ZWJ9_MAHA5|nr:DUF3006 domain-containing protein [Mahella australiensis]AEE95434.1 hypothetical protein Mahau_0216 [Mahella australiensis 50-1 BON]
MKSFIIDRFEGRWAVIEYGDDVFNLPKEVLPEGSKEGDVLDIDIKVDEEATRARKQRIQRMADQLFEEG